MVTYDKDLLMAFVYFDQSHCGYLLEKDLEEIMYTLGLHLSRAQVLYIYWNRFKTIYFITLWLIFESCLYLSYNYL